jgi:anti-sigma factor RsiW
MTSGFERIDHLNLDAIVAYADGEMGMVAFQRAATHVERCPQCNAEVTEQIAARAWLRSASAPTIPLGLLDSLKSIPAAVPPSAPAPGLSVDSAGRAYRTNDPLRSGHGRSRLFRFGAGALVAGIAVGAVVASSAAEPRDQQRQNQVAQLNGSTMLQPVLFVQP